MCCFPQPKVSPCTPRSGATQIPYLPAGTSAHERKSWLISWSNGANSVVESGWWQPHLGGLEADTEVYGTLGYARVFPAEPPDEQYEHCTQPMYTAQMKEFIDAVLQGREPRPNGEDGRVVMRIVEEAYRSSRA